MESAAADHLPVGVAFRDPELLDVLVKDDGGFVEQDPLLYVLVEQAAQRGNITGARAADRH